MDSPLFPPLPPLLPAGSLVVPDSRDAPPGREGLPLLWLSSEPAGDPGVLWARLHGLHPSSGLWPLLVAADSSLGVDDLWILPADPMAVADATAEEALAEMWADLCADYEEDADDEGDAAEDEFVPRGPFPGLAPASAEAWDADAVARDNAEAVSKRDDSWRLALIPAPSGAEALAVAGWSGPLNHTNDIARLAAVVRSWEQRFGVRVVAVDGATLHLSVAAPPHDLDHARAIALEHFAFCPDNLWQSDTPMLDEYAETLVDTDDWSFWWD